MRKNIFRDLCIKTATLNYIPIRHDWLTESSTLLVLAVGYFSSMLERKCLVNGTSLSPIILNPVAMKHKTSLDLFFKV